MKTASPRSLALLASALLASAAQGAISLEVTGGNGSPLTITLLETVTYTISPGAPEDDFYPLFVIDEAVTGEHFNINVAGTMTFSINDGEMLSFNNMFRGMNGGDMTANDILLASSKMSLEEGDVITLHAGYLTTILDVDALPAGGSSFESFMIKNTGSDRISGDAVPEPSAAALLGLGAAGFVLRRKRRA